MQTDFLLKQLAPTRTWSRGWKLPVFIVTGVALLTCHVSVVMAAPRLTLAVQLPSSFTRFSAVAAEVIVRNESDGPVVLENFPEVSDLSVEVRQVAAGQRAYRGPVCLPDRVVKERFRPPVTIRAGESARFGAVLACRWSFEQKPSGAMFDEAADYSLLFSYPVQFQQAGAVAQVVMTSLPVVVHVIEVADSQKPALGRILQMPMPEAILDPEGTLRGMSAMEMNSLAGELRTHLRDWPTSPWVPLARWTLAEILKNQAFASGRTPDRARLTEAMEQIELLSVATNFPHAGQVRGTRTYLRKSMGSVGAGATTNGLALLPANLPPEATRNIQLGLQQIANALRSGSSEQFIELLAGDFLMNDRLDRLQAAAQLAVDRNRLKGTALDVQVELRSAEVIGDGYRIEARFRSQAGQRDETQLIRLEGLFAANQVQLRRWNRIAGNTGTPP